MCCCKDPCPFLTWYLPTPWSNLVEILWTSAPFHVLLLSQVPKRSNKGLKNYRPPKLRFKGYCTNLMFHLTSIQQLHKKYFLIKDVHFFPSFPFPLHNYSHVFLAMFNLFFLHEHHKFSWKKLSEWAQEFPTPPMSPPLSQEWTSYFGQWEWRGIISLLSPQINWLSSLSQGNPPTSSASQWGLEEINFLQSNVDGIPLCNEITWLFFFIFLFDPFNHDLLLTLFHPSFSCSSKGNYLQK